MPIDYSGGPLIGSAEAADVLGVSKATLVRWVAKGRVVPLQQLPGLRGAYLFSRPQIMRLAQRRIEEKAAS
jgi:excisionase family DNA binding protein